MLLPGDAEWGTWKRILENERSRDILEGATFIKVGHHGSHNATSKTLVEAVLPRKISAMISTQEGKGSFRNKIPLPELLQALEKRDILYARSDTPQAPDGFKPEADFRWIDATLPC